MFFNNDKETSLTIAVGKGICVSNMSGEFHSSIEEVVLTDSTSKDEIHNEISNSLSCDLCNVKVTSAKILQRHFDGRKHKMKAERKGKNYICELCDVVANSEIQLNIHMNSIKHKNKILKKDGKEEFVLPFLTRNAGVWILLFCVICIFINLLLVFKVICY